MTTLLEEVADCAPSIAGKSWENEDGGAGMHVGLRIEEPLRHQVAGHDQIFKASGGKLFKPLVQREFWFYDQCLPSAPEEYPQFCPKYFGTAELNHDEWQELKEALD